MNRPRIVSPRARRLLPRLGKTAIVVFLALLPIWWLAPPRRDAADLEPAPFAYPAATRGECPDGLREGGAGATRIAAADGLPPIELRTPANYRATHAHPLLVVYAPNGAGGLLVERLTGLTGLATRAGYVVAYAGSLPLSLATIRRLGEIPGKIAARWCIDRARVVVAGHSDGGTAAEALAFLPETRDLVAGVIASAAGLRGEDLAKEACPAPLPVLLLHGAGDRLFKGHGREAAAWWARCNRCEAPPEPAVGACAAATGCPAESPLRYCELDASHTEWPERPMEILQLLETVRDYR